MIKLTAPWPQTHLCGEGMHQNRLSYFFAFMRYLSSSFPSSLHHHFRHHNPHHHCHKPPSDKSAQSREKTIISVSFPESESSLMARNLHPQHPGEKASRPTLVLTPTLSWLGARKQGHAYVTCKERKLILDYTYSNEGNKKTSKSNNVFKSISQSILSTYMITNFISHAG